MCPICSFKENFLHVIRTQVIHSKNSELALSLTKSLCSNLSARSCIFSILFKDLDEQKRQARRQ